MLCLIFTWFCVDHGREAVQGRGAPVRHALTVPLVARLRGDRHLQGVRRHGLGGGHQRRQEQGGPHQAGFRRFHQREQRQSNSEGGAP